MHQREVDCVNQRSTPKWSGSKDFTVNLIGVEGEGHLELWPLTEFDQEELIAGVRSFEEGCGGARGLVNFIGHAAAGIENQPDRERCVLFSEIRNILLNAVFEHPEVWLK